MPEETHQQVDLRNLKFQLVANDTGLALAATIMHFADATAPCKATYHGPNILAGQALMHQNQMLY